LRFLGDFPVLRRDSRSDPTTRLRELADGAEAVLVLDRAVEPDPSADSIRIDDVFNLSETPIGFVARSYVTGLFITDGAVLVPAALPDVTVPKPTVTLPYSVGVYNGHSTPEEAFENGFRSVENQHAETALDQARLALAASLGLDALNGAWWILGALSSLARNRTIADAWAELEWLLEEPNETDRQIRIEARRTRQATGLPVRALTQSESRAMKAILPPWPSSTIWRRFQEESLELKPDAAAAASRICAAAAWLWPELVNAEELA